MPNAISSMLFGQTHSVEQLVKITNKKKVNAVLLKVIRVIRTKGNVSGWIKPTVSLTKDLKLSTKVIASIMKTLGEYYQIDLTKKAYDTPMAIVNAIKLNKSKVTNSLYIFDKDDMVLDNEDQIQPDGEADPYAAVPKDPPAPEGEPATTDPLPAESDIPPVPPTTGTTEAELKEDEQTVEQSDDTGEKTEEEEIANQPDASASTEGLEIKPKEESWGSILGNL